MLLLARVLLGTSINSVTVVIFIIANVVIWLQAILMIVGTIISGYTGAYFARKIKQKWIRYFVLVVGFAITIYFFMRP